MTTPNNNAQNSLNDTPSGAAATNAGAAPGAAAANAAANAAHKAPQGPAWARSVDENEFSFSAAVGGTRGVLESVLPGLTFVALFVLTSDVWVTSLVSGGVALLALVLAAVQRTGLQQALTGFVGVAIGVVWALATGKGESFYTWGIITSAVFLTALVISILMRAPLVAVTLGLVRGYQGAWYLAPEHARLLSRCTLLTWLWAGMFAIRLAVELPLWFYGYVGALGVAKLVLGVPLFAVVAWLTWVGLKPFHLQTPQPSEGAEDLQPTAQN